MLFNLPDHETLYKALLNRDERYDGHVFVCVSTTRVFCRLTCPARKPRTENCTFYASVGECINAGCRPCKRCHPLQTSATFDPAIETLLKALDNRPDIRWSEQTIVQHGYDPSTVRRTFKRQFGMTFLEMARQRRLREGFNALSKGCDVLTAQHEASFESGSAFRSAFARLMGCAPSALNTHGFLLASWISTPLGDMIAISSLKHLYLLEFVDRKALPAELKTLQKSTNQGIGIGSPQPTQQAQKELASYFAGECATFDTPLAFCGSSFSQSVWEALQQIPAGQTRSYSDIARSIGKPTATRAVARANGDNQIALMVPCHRVIGADGNLTGYGGGLWRKQRLIDIERQFASSQQETMPNESN